MNFQDFQWSRRTLLTAVAASAMSGPAAFAQSGGDWPQRPVKIVVSLPAGTGVDTIARLLADSLTKSQGQSFIVDNKPGGQNLIGAQYAAKSAADGYTIFLATASTLVTNSYLFKQMPYNPRQDFAPIDFIGHSPFALFVRPDSPYKTLSDYLAKSKSSPGKISLGNEGPKAFGGITARLLNAKTGAQLNLVPYASSNVALQDLMGGQIDAFVGDIASAAQLTRQGKLRMLVVTSLKPVPGWNVPTVSELVPGFDMVGWIAMVAPAGTPAVVINKLNKDIEVALKNKDMAEKINAIGPVPQGLGTPANLASFLEVEHKRWEEISREIGLLPE